MEWIEEGRRKVGYRREPAHGHSAAADGHREGAHAGKQRPPGQHAEPPRAGHAPHAVHEARAAKPAEKPREEKKKGPYCKTKEEILALPLGGFTGPIFLAYSSGTAERAASELLREKMLGFDTETKPNFIKGRKQNPIGLVQISTLRKAYLFRVNETGMTPALKKLLESPHVIKIGQGMKNEIAAMKKDLGVAGRGFIDLLDIAHKLECDPKSVRAMTGIFLGFRISKSMQVTNWEARVLSEKQKRYAATDAWACLAVYKELERRGLLKNIKANTHR